MLSELIPSQLGLENLKAIHKAVYAGQVARPQIARLIISVVIAATAGDKVAQHMLNQAGQRMANTALAVVSQLNVKDSGITVYPTGGVYQSSKLVETAFSNTLLNLSPKVIVKESHFHQLQADSCWRWKLSKADIRKQLSTTCVLPSRVKCSQNIRRTSNRLN